MMMMMMMMIVMAEIIMANVQMSQRIKVRVKERERLL